MVRRLATTRARGEAAVEWREERVRPRARGEHDRVAGERAAVGGADPARTTVGGDDLGDGRVLDDLDSGRAGDGDEGERRVRRADLDAAGLQKPPATAAGSRPGISSAACWGVSERDPSGRSG